MGVCHLQRLKNPGAQKVVEGAFADRFDQRPENVGVVAIDPLFARMRVERKRSDPLDSVSDWFVTIGEIPALNPCGLPAVTGRTVAVANP